MSYYGFVYEWLDSSNGKKYIGSHHGSSEDGYVGSGVAFKRAYKKRSELFTRTILAYNTISDDPYVTYGLEQKYLDQIPDIHLNESYYNLSPFAAHPGGWNKGLINHPALLRSEETKQKISDAHKGRIINWSEKISKAKTGRTKENDEGRRVTSAKLIGNQNGAGRSNTPKGKIWISNGSVSKMVLREDLEKYPGFVPGRGIK